MSGEPYDTGRASLAVPSPDGSRVVFRWVEDLERRQLRVLDDVTGQSWTIMTWDRDPLFPLAWTPEGDSVFASQYPYNSQGETKVLLIPAAGGTPRLVRSIPVIGTGWGMSVSSDGRWLVYNHELSRNQEVRSDIYIIDVQGGGARALVEHPGLDMLVGWLPGTDVVLFSSDRMGTRDLWSVRVVNGRASGEPRRVLSGFLRSHAVGFGDGALFYRVETGSMGHAVINVDPHSGALGAASPPLSLLGSPFARDPVWSPDGQTLAAPFHERLSFGIAVHSLATGDSRVFWLDDEGVRAYAVEWAADGEALLLRAGEGPYPLTESHHFLRLDLGTGAVTQLFAAEPGEPYTLRRFAVTPDGRSMVLRQRTLDDDRTEVKLVLRSIDDGSERELYRTSGFIPELSISADGTQLAFMQQDGGESDSLFVMAMDGSQPLRAIANWDHGWNDAVSLLGWLPAGNALLGARLTEDRKGEEILRIDLDGSTTVVGISPFRPSGDERVEGIRRSGLVLSPAGNRILQHVSDYGRELWRMDGLPELFADDAPGRR